jgi:hypothetical protein
MPTKRGCVTELVRVGPKFVQVRISGGEKVELPLALWDLVQTRYRPDQGASGAAMTILTSDRWKSHQARAGSIRKGPAPL